MASLSARPLLSRTALSKHLQHISLPSLYAASPLLSVVRSAEGLSYLTALQKYQQATVPFASLYLHYSKNHTSTLNPYELYEYTVNGGGIAREGAISTAIADGGWHDVTEHTPCSATAHYEGDKMGVRGGRGGSCVLDNGFFGTVMRSLGHDMMSTGAHVAQAVNGGPKNMFGGWDHMTNIVALDGKKYLGTTWKGVGVCTPLCRPEAAIVISFSNSVTRFL